MDPTDVPSEVTRQKDALWGLCRYTDIFWRGKAGTGQSDQFALKGQRWKTWIF